MAIKNNDLVKGLGGFGEGFLKTLQYERERARRDQEFNQNMAFQVRQMNLLDTYRNASLQQDQSQFQQKLGQDQSQFSVGMDFKNKSLLEDMRQFDLSNKLKEQEVNRDYEMNKSRLSLGWSELGQRKDEFKAKQNEVEQYRSDVDQRQVEELFGKSKGLLDEIKNAEFDKDKYSGWKADASSNVSQLLEKLKIPINGDIVNKLRSVLEDSDDPEARRKYLNEAINELYSMGEITDEQKRALQLWKELGTR